jgi:benzoyl-CoA reductase subunit C
MGLPKTRHDIVYRKHLSKEIVMDVVDPFKEIAADSKAYARQWKEKTGGRVVGTLCSYAPEELIFAAGALPFRIFGGGGDISRADAHLQAYSCSLVRGALEDALAGRLDFLDGIVFPHTCDSIQRLSDIWRMNVPGGFHLDAVLPVKLDTDSARAYMAAVMGKCKADLEQSLGKTISEEDMAGAIGVYNGIRSGMKKLYTLRRDHPGLIPGSDLHAVVKASMVMDRNDFLLALTVLTDALAARTGKTVPAGKRLFLSGGVCNLPDIYPIIESAGGTVVWDDLCTGSRQLTGPIEIDGDPVAAIARRYAERAICPAKHSGITARGDELVRQAKATGAQGVIFLFLKFCDPHAFDYPYLKQMLDDEGIPSLLVELEEQIPSEGQLQTRCEAFIEML